MSVQATAMMRSSPLKSAAGSVTVAWPSEPGLDHAGPQGDRLDRRDGQALAAQLVAAEVDVGRRAEVGVEQAAVVVAIVDA